MEKPSVVFSDQGWKEFLKFMRDVSIPQDDEEGDHKVNKFVKDYYSHASTGSNTLSEAHTRIKVALTNSQLPMSTVELRRLLEDHGHTVGQQGNTITNIIEGAMEHFPEIEQVTARSYGIKRGENNG